jgi:uncharacterized protein (TIGR02246 family)
MTVPLAIEKLHQADVDATLKRDVDALLELWDDNGVLLQPGHPPVIGKTAFVEFLTQTLAKSASMKVLKYAPDIRDVQVEGDVAYEWGYFDSIITPSDLDQPTNFRARFVRILRRQPGGSWRFIRVMWGLE